MSTPLRPDLVRGIALSTWTSLPEHAEINVTGVSLDSRTLLAGDLYVALPGLATHGSHHAAEAVERGAVAILTDAAGQKEAKATGVPVLVHEDPRREMARLAAEVYGNPAKRLLLLAVTGTTGKTTTVFMLEAALASAGRRVGTIGTVGFRLFGHPLESSRTTVTTPEAPDLHALLAVMLERGADTVVMEVSSHALALDRVAGLHFEVAGFTNLGWDHQDFHPTQEDYFEAKARLFTPELTDAGVISVDDEWGVKLAERVRSQKAIFMTTTGVDDAADYQATRWWTLPEGSLAVKAATPSGKREFVLGMPGEHNVQNAMTALGMLSTIGLANEAALSGMAAVRVPGRLERVPLEGVGAPVVLVDFAHTPEAVASALAAVSGRRVIAVLGCGGDRDAAKRGPMGKAAVEGADSVVVTDDNPRTEDPEAIREAVLAGARAARASAPEGSRASQARIVDGGDRRTAIRTALIQAGPTDVVAILGKGHEIGQEVDGEILEFSDAIVAKEEWARINGKAVSQIGLDEVGPWTL